MDLMLLAIFWVVWKEMNKMTFDRVEDIDSFDILKSR